MRSGVALSFLDDLAGGSGKQKVPAAVPHARFAGFFFVSAVMLISEVPAIGVLEDIDNASLLLQFGHLVGVAWVVQKSSSCRRMKGSAHSGRAGRRRIGIFAGDHDLGVLYVWIQRVLLRLRHIH